MWLPVARARLGDPHLLRFAKLCAYLASVGNFIFVRWCYWWLKKQISVRSASSVFDINYVVARVRLGDPHLLRFLLIWNLWEAFLLEGCVSEIRTYYGLLNSVFICGKLYIRSMVLLMVEKNKFPCVLRVPCSI